MKDKLKFILTIIIIIVFATLAIHLSIKWYNFDVPTGIKAGQVGWIFFKQNWVEYIFLFLLGISFSFFK